VIKNPNATLIAIVDPSPHGAQLAAQLNTTYYPTVSALLSSPHIPHAAIICTPNTTHVPIATQLASAGIAILVEKPLSSDISSGRTLLAHVKACNVKLLVGHHRRFQPCIAHAKAILCSPPDAKASLGRILALSGHWTARKPDAYFAPPLEWHRDAGAVLVNLIHDVDALQYLFGPISRVHAEATPSTREFTAEEGAALILRFASGVVGTFLLCDAAPSPWSFEAGTGENPTIPKTGRDFYRVFGTRGALSVPDLVRFAYEDEADGDEGDWTRVVREQKVGAGEEEVIVPFDKQMEHFVSLVKGEVDKPMCSGEDGLRALMVCEAVKEAIRTGMGVDVGEV
jgi:predicted dehydrogenase